MYNCNKVKVLWNEVKLICTPVSFDEDFSISLENVIYNTPRDNPKVVENVIVLITKSYIYKTKCLNEKLSINALRNCLREYKEIERNIALRKHKIDHHNAKWENVQL